MRKRTPNPDDVKLSPSVPKDVWRRLKDLSRDQNRSINDLLNEWIAEKLALLDQPEEGRKGGELCPA